MFGLFKEKKQNELFKVSYVLSCHIRDGEAVFNIDRDMQSILVEAPTLIDVQRNLGKFIPLTPHVYIHSIKKIDIKHVTGD